MNVPLRMEPKACIVFVFVVPLCLWSLPRQRNKAHPEMRCFLTSACPPASSGAGGWGLVM